MPPQNSLTNAKVHGPLALACQVLPSHPQKAAPDSDQLPAWLGSRELRLLALPRELEAPLQLLCPQLRLISRSHYLRRIAVEPTRKQYGQRAKYILTHI